MAAAAIRRPGRRWSGPDQERGLANAHAGIRCQPSRAAGPSYLHLLRPATLLCLHRDDGKILWQKTAATPNWKSGRTCASGSRWNWRTNGGATRSSRPSKRTWITLHRALVRDKAPRKEIDTKLQPFRKQIDELKKEKQKLTVAVLYTQPGVHPAPATRRATPVTNGKDVFVAFGNGLVACFDLDGNRQWLKLIEHSNAAFAHSGSPVLVGDKLLIHFTDLVALDTKTGTESWRLKYPTAHGTPLATRIGDVDVVLTPRGRDGTGSGWEAPGRQARLLWTTPPCCTRGLCTTSAARPLSHPPAEIGRKPVKVEVLWKGKAKGGGYWFSLARGTQGAAVRGERSGHTDGPGCRDRARGFTRSPQPGRSDLPEPVAGGQPYLTSAATVGRQSSCSPDGNTRNWPATSWSRSAARWCSTASVFTCGRETPVLHRGVVRRSCDQPCTLR